MGCITYGLSWKIFLHATAGVCNVVEDVIEIGTVDEGEIWLFDDVVKVGACVVDDTDTVVVSLELPAGKRKDCAGLGLFHDGNNDQIFNKYNINSKNRWYSKESIFLSTGRRHLIPWRSYWVYRISSLRRRWTPWKDILDFEILFLLDKSKLAYLMVSMDSFKSGYSNKGRVIHTESWLTIVILSLVGSFSELFRVWSHTGIITICQS